MRSWLLGPLLFVCVLSGYLLSFNVDQPSHNGDWYLRYQVTCAIVEHNSFAITPFQVDARTGPGLRHQIYAQYTLGQSAAMIPLYLLGRRLTGLAHTDCASPIAPAVVLLTCKLLGPILGALLAVLCYATARLLAYPRRGAFALTALLAFGSSLWPDVQSNLEHTMESLFLLAAAYAALRYTRESRVESRESRVGRRGTLSTGSAGVSPAVSAGSAGFQSAYGRGGAGHRRFACPRWLAGWRRGVSLYVGALPVDPRDLWLVTMGLAAGLVFVTRVAGLIAILIFALYLVALHVREVDSRKSIVDSETATRGTGLRRGRTLAQRAYYRLSTIDHRLLRRDLALYGAGVLPSLLVTAAYDAARFGSPFKTEPYPDQSFGYPPWLGLPNLLVSPGKGLLWYTPALLLLALAARPFWRRCPRPAILFALICGVYLVFYANVNYWHGDPAWGPRYLYATLPYLVLPLGEVFARWRGYRRPARAALVGVLALSFLVQFSATTVSYWRHWHYIYGYHYDQVENHSWGQNLNYWWSPEQSPVLLSLTGIADITQKYVDHAPLVQHLAAERLSNPDESCGFHLYGREANICLTDLDDLRFDANWNTFTMWWVHVYPWWPQHTVIALAVALLGLFVASGGALVLLLSLIERPGWGGARAAGAYDGAPKRDGQGHGGNNGNGHGSGNGKSLPLDIAVLPRLDVTREPGADVYAGVGPAGGGYGAVAIQAPPTPRVAASPPAGATRAITGLAPLGLASVIALLVYGGIMDAAALTAPRQVPPLIRQVPRDTTVRDGNWTYRVLDVTALPALPGGIDAPAFGHHYVVVRLRLSNGLTRPHHVRLENFSLTDDVGLSYPNMYIINSDFREQVGELYHLTPLGMQVPARGSVDNALVFLVRNGARHLKLLGPGIALVDLDQ